MNTLSKLYKDRLSLLTDLYQLTMAKGYWECGLYDRPAVFHLFFRKNPFGGHYSIAAGLQLVIDYLQGIKFEKEDIQYLGQLKGADGLSLFDESFLNYLQRMEFSCDVDAIPEGTVVSANEPLLRIKGPLLQAQLIETALLNIVNFSTLIATKAARVCQAAGEDEVLEFGMRRSHGIDGGLMASRSAYIGGCQATSNLLAGKLYDIPVKGTHAHSWVMAFESEKKSFASYAEALPNNCIFLVDTYDTHQGILNAIEIGKELKAKGHQLLGIRLDSGQLEELSKEARLLLDKAGFEATKIVASNDLDEYRIKALKANGAPINVWGVGTRLATAYDQPALGGVYKLAALQNEEGAWDYKVKLSEQSIKTSNPGIQQVRRYFNDGKIAKDILYDASLLKTKHSVKEINNAEPYDRAENLLVPVFEKGKLIYDCPNIHDIRQRTILQVSQIPSNGFPVELEEQLALEKSRIINRLYRTLTYDKV